LIDIVERIAGIERTYAWIAEQLERVTPRAGVK
jgi:hypothetical protein